MTSYNGGGVDAEVIKEATFCIQYEGGLGVFYTPNLAVISNMSVPEELEAGSSVKVISPGLGRDNWYNLELVARNADKDFAVLKSADPHAYIPVCVDSAAKLLSEGDLTVASFQLGVSFAPMSQKRLGYSEEVETICLSDSKQYLLCSSDVDLKDDPALLLKNDELVGLTRGSLTAMREKVKWVEAERKKQAKGKGKGKRVACEVDEGGAYPLDPELEQFMKTKTASKEVSQGCVALLAHRFAGVQA